MTDVPSNLIPSRITQLPEYTGNSTIGYLPYVWTNNLTAAAGYHNNHPSPSVTRGGREEFFRIPHPSPQIGRLRQQPLQRLRPHLVTERQTEVQIMEIFDYDNILLLPRQCRVESRSDRA